MVAWRRMARGPMAGDITERTLQLVGRARLSQLHSGRMRLPLDGWPALAVRPCRFGSSLRSFSARAARDGVGELSARLITRFPSTAQLAQAGLPELIREGGLSLRQAAALIAARELGRRLYAAPPARRPSIRTPADVVALVGPEMRYLDREHFCVLLLNTRHQVLAVGGLNSAMIHPREVFKTAIRWGAAAVILVHNHPSGDPEPSADDLRITARLAEAGSVVGIEVLDHVVPSDGRYVSLRERGALAG